MIEIVARCPWPRTDSEGDEADHDTAERDQIADQRQPASGDRMANERCRGIRQRQPTHSFDKRGGHDPRLAERSKGDTRMLDGAKQKQSCIPRADPTPTVYS